MTGNLRDSQARRYDQALFRACGCHLAYHKGRRAYVVYRPRGSRAAPITYIDAGTPNEPLRMCTLPWVIGAVRLADAKRAQDWEKALDICNSRMADTSRDETKAFVSDVWPEYWKDLCRLHEMLGDGKVRSKYFDVKQPTG